MEVTRKSLKRKAQSIEEADVCIKTEDGAEYLVRQEILIGASDYFKKLFLYNTQQEILIRGISGDAMKMILCFVLTETVMLNSENIADLLHASDYFMLKGMSKKIKSSIPDLICERNCVQLYEAASKLEHLDVLQIIHTYVQIHFPTIVRHSRISDLSFKNFEKILSDDNLNVKNESLVWKAIVKWIESGEVTKYEVVPLLLCCLRLEICSEHLIQEIIGHPIVQENYFCNGLIPPNKLNSHDHTSVHKYFIGGIKNVKSGLIDLGARRHQRVVCRISYNHSMNNRGIELSVEQSEYGRKSIIGRSRLYLVPKFALCCGRKVFVFAVKGRIYAFDLLDDQWSRHIFEDNIIKHVSYAQVNGQVYKSWITSEPSAVATIAPFDPNSNTVQAGKLTCLMAQNVLLRILDANVNHIDSTALDGMIYVAAKAEVDAQVVMLGSVYNAETSVWSSFRLPEVDVTSYFTIVAYRGALHFIRSEQRTVFRFEPRKGLWEVTQELPGVLRQPRAVVYESMLIVYDVQSYSNGVYWNEDAQQWENITDQWSGSGIICEVEDPEVVWSYRDQFRKREWSEAAARWKQSVQ